MSIASEITRINNNIANAYTQCNSKGATMPQTQNSANLSTTIASIPTGGGSLVPSDYTLLDYLETRNTGYINTGYYPNDNTSYEVSCQVNCLSKVDGALFGSRTSAGSSDELVLWHNNGSNITTETISPRRGYVSYAAPSITYINGFFWRVIKLENKVFSVDGVVKHTYSNTAVTATYPLYFLAMNNAGSLDSRGYQGKVKYLVIKENNVEIRAYVPVMRNSDSVVGFYELVNGTFHSNQKDNNNFYAGPVANKYS